MSSEEVGGTRAEEIRLRPELPQDLDFSCRLYASARAEEMSAVPWTDVQKDAFLRSQFLLQHSHYRTHYPGADFSIIVVGEADAGRLYVHRSPSEIRLMEITLLPEYRRRGIGGKLTGELLAEGRLSGRKIGLHVEMHNPARRLYERLGFRVISEEDVYARMEWP